jgi:O-antigen/teichoic acid export membrane protein
LPAGRWGWRLAWLGRLVEFSFVQSWVQLFTAVAGLIVIRTLSKDEYALYAIANTIQASADMLAELGIGIGMQSIGGRVWRDRLRLSELVATARHLRRILAAVSIAACLPFAVWMLRTNGAGWVTTLILCGVVVASILPQIGSSVLLVVLGILGEYRKVQRLNVENALLRLGAVALLATSYMNAWLVAGVAAAVNWKRLFDLRRWTSVYIDNSARENADDRRELVRLSTRLLPNTLFYCFQGQITLIILSWFGNSTGIADVTALGRLSALLMVFSTAFSHVLVPRFARCQDAGRLPGLYIQLVGGCLGILLPVVVAGWLLPKPLLWVLGSKYSQLEDQCGWVVSAACVSQLAAVMSQLNGARAWIRIGTLSYVPVTIITQILALSLLDVSHLEGVVIFAFVSSLAPIVPLALDAVLGLRMGGKPTAT